MRIDSVAINNLSMPFSEQKQTQALESLAGVILISLDVEGCIEQINSRGCEFLGFCLTEMTQM